VRNVGYKFVRPVRGVGAREQARIEGERDKTGAGEQADAADPDPARAPA